MSLSPGSTAHSQPQLAPASVLGSVAPRSSPSLFTSFSTEDVPQAQRHAYWMANAYRAVEAYVPNPAGLHGRAMSCQGAGAQFVRCESSTVHTRLTPQRLRAQLSDEHIAVCLLEAGEYLVEEEDGTRVRIGAGELFMFDCGQPMSSVWSESVASYLQGRGVIAARIGTQGFGSTRPVATNSTPEGRQANRRVEIKIVPLTENDVRG